MPQLHEDRLQGGIDRGSCRSCCTLLQRLSAMAQAKIDGVLMGYAHAGKFEAEKGADYSTMTDEEFDDVIAVGLRGPFLCTREAGRAMKEQGGGHIIQITSASGLVGNFGQTNYAAAKAGMMGFSKSLAREIGSRGITVNVVAPGFIDTDMTRALDESQKQSLLDDIPLQRLGQPGDIAGTVLFLASRQGSYITGQTLHVNGGMYMA